MHDLSDSHVISRTVDEHTVHRCQSQARQVTPKSVCRRAAPPASRPEQPEGTPLSIFAPILPRRDNPCLGTDAEQWPFPNITIGLTPISPPSPPPSTHGPALCVDGQVCRHRCGPGGAGGQVEDPCDGVGRAPSVGGRGWAGAQEVGGGAQDAFGGADAEVDEVRGGERVGGGPGSLLHNELGGFVAEVMLFVVAVADAEEAAAELGPEVFGAGAAGLEGQAGAQHCTITMRRAGCGRLLRRGAGRGCRSSSSSRRGGRGAPAPCGCPGRAREGAWRTNGGGCGRSRACRSRRRGGRGARLSAGRSRGGGGGARNRWARGASGWSRGRPIARATPSARSGTFCGGRWGGRRSRSRRRGLWRARSSRTRGGPAAARWRPAGGW